MRRAAWLLGYHGCDRKVGEAILRGDGDLKISANPYDWLGTGAYFWENSHTRALHWAKYLKTHPEVSKTKISEPFVIGAIIDPGNCLDLTDTASLQLLKAAYKPFLAALESAGLPLPENEAAHSADEDLVKRKLDCAVINYFHDLHGNRNAFDSIRGPFLEGSALFPGSKISSRSHIQWCVRSPAKSVLGYFKPRLHISGI